MQTELFVELNELMLKYRFKPNKKLAQHFIVNENLIERIISEAKLSKEDVVLEIGAGTGFLTRELLKETKVVAIEKDKKLCEFLAENFAGEIKSAKLNLICKDFLKLDLQKIKFNKVVSFPPYYISSKILFALLPLKVELMLFVFQKEFVERLTALAGFSNYNALTIAANYFGNLQILETIPKSYFFPRPNAESVLIKITPKERKEKAKDEKLFLLFVKAIFRHPNKNLKNALILAKKDFEKEGKTLPINFENKIEGEMLNKKVSHIPIDEWVEIFNKLT